MTWDALIQALPSLAAALSLILMGLCGVQLLARLTRVLRGQEEVDGLPKNQPRRFAPLSSLLAVAGVALLSRVAVYLLGYAWYRGLGIGADSFADSFMPLWCHWDVNHYLNIARDGYVATGDERLRLVFFPLYPLCLLYTSDAADE